MHKLGKGFASIQVFGYPSGHSWGNYQEARETK